MVERMKVAMLAVYIAVSILAGAVFHQELGFSQWLASFVGLALGGALLFIVIRPAWDLLTRSDY